MNDGGTTALAAAKGTRARGFGRLSAITTALVAVSAAGAALVAAALPGSHARGTTSTGSAGRTGSTASSGTNSGTGSSSGVGSSTGTGTGTGTGLLSGGGSAPVATSGGS